MAKAKTAAEVVLETDAEVPMPDVDEVPWMPTPGAGLGLAFDPLANPKVAEIVRTLGENLLLVEPTLRFVRQKRAEVSAAQLGVLYTAEELERLMAEARE